MHSIQQIGAAMTWLLTRGYVRPVGTHKRMALFSPGPPLTPHGELCTVGVRVEEALQARA
jgi:hypothetical protein